MIVFDGTDASVTRIRKRIRTIIPTAWVSRVGGTLHVNGRKFGLGTSFDVARPDTVKICLPSAVEKIEMEFKI